MLKEFRVKNFRSFRDEQIFSMEAMDIVNEALDYDNIAQIKNQRILKSVAIFGHNSFGKTNLLTAIATMKDLIRSSSNIDYRVKVEPFRLNDFSKNEPTKFEIIFLLKNMEYRYGFEIFLGKIVKEWLFNKDINIYERLGSNFNEINIGEIYKEKYEKYKEFTREEELFLSSMIKSNVQDEIKEIYNFLVNNILVMGNVKVNSNSSAKYIYTSKLINEEKIKKDDVVEALKTADLGIIQLDIKKKGIKLDELPETIKSNIKLDNPNIEEIETVEEFLLHNIYSKTGEKIGEIPFDLYELESEGTEKFYSILGPILLTLSKGSILFIDEFDSKLHYVLAKYLIKLFNNNHINNKNAQLIFNTHNFYILKEGLFRDDQIYFVDKDRYGNSSIYSMGDFKSIEEVSNSDKLNHYLLGNFGSIGQIG